MDDVDSFFNGEHYFVVLAADVICYLQTMIKKCINYAPNQAPVYFSRMRYHFKQNFCCSVLVSILNGLPLRSSQNLIVPLQ